MRATLHSASHGALYATMIMNAVMGVTNLGAFVKTLENVVAPSQPQVEHSHHQTNVLIGMRTASIKSLSQWALTLT